MNWTTFFITLAFAGAALAFMAGLIGTASAYVNDRNTKPWVILWASSAVLLAVGAGLI